MRRFVLLAFVLLLCVTVVSPSAEGSLLTLSTHSSNGFEPYTRAEYLDAVLDFSITNGSELRLVVTNTTNVNPPDYQFNIVEIFLNYGGGVTGLTWADKATLGWTLDVQLDNIHVDLFGYYDVALRDEATPDKAIKPGFSETFDFIIGGTGPFSEDNFTIYLSANGEDVRGLAAAKFVGGGPDDIAWAYGMVVPEPATILLLGLGGLALLRKRRQ